MTFESIRQRVLDGATIAASLCALVLGGLALKDRLSPPPQLAVAPGFDTTSVPVANWLKLIRAGHRMGPDNAVVTILEFGDFECPACRAVERSIRAVRAKHRTSVAVVFRHWPLSYHRFAYPSARAAECAAEQGEFAEYHDLLFGLQDSLGLLSFTEVARRAGVRDTSAFGGCIRRPGAVRAIDDDTAAAREAGGHFTPTLIVNGIRLATVPDSARLEELVERVLNRSATSSTTTSSR